MTYIDIINRFWKIDINYNFSHLQVHLFFKLLEMANRSGWNEKLSVPNNRLSGMVGFTETSLISCRQRLNDTGVIQYQKGTTRRAGKYIVDPHYFTQLSNNRGNDAVITGVIPLPYIRQDKEVDKERTIKDKSKAPKIPYEEILKLYHEICISLPKVIKLTKARKAKIKKRWTEIKSIKLWEELFRKVETTPFLCGDNNRNWKASFDFLIANETNWVKIMEGRYSNGKNTKSDAGNNKQDISRNPAGTSTDFDELEEMLVFNKK